MPKLFFNGDRLEFVPVHRHLGLLISENLSWTNFIDSVVNSAFKKLGLLKKSSSSKLAEKTYRNYILLSSDLCLNMLQLFGMAVPNKMPKSLKKYN